MSAPFPSRHCADVPNWRARMEPFRRLARIDGEPSGVERWAIGEGLLRGDEPADVLVAWMHRAGLAKAFDLFESALERGLARIADAPPELQTFFETIEGRPSWFDAERAEFGIVASLIPGMRGGYALRDLALMGGYRFSGLNQPLIATGALTRGPQRRVDETTRWWLDCMTPGGLERFGIGFKSAVRVRVIHALVRYRLTTSPEWSTERWGVPINQSDLALTLLGFSAVYLAGTRALGVPITRREGAAAMHRWKYIGWLMGVEDRWLVDDERAGRTLTYHLALCQPPSDESAALLGAALRREPLARTFAHTQWLRRRLDYAKHLSVLSYFVSKKDLELLGVPRGAWPWYPACSVPLTALRHVYWRLRPNGLKRLLLGGFDDLVSNWQLYDPPDEARVVRSQQRAHVRRFAETVGRESTPGVFSAQRLIDGLERRAVGVTRLIGKERRVNLNPNFFAKSELRSLLLRLGGQNDELSQAVSSVRRRPGRRPKPL